MQVFEVQHGMQVLPNRVYIIPPNRDMAFESGTLQLLDPAAPHGKRMPINFFFRSLAQVQQERAIGIVLSGTGSDGTLGVRAIKGEGGMVMVQDPESAEHGGMPDNAIATGQADYVLPPAEMPAQIMSYVAQALEKPFKTHSVFVPQNEDALKKIIVQLRNHTGHDFSQYKPNTLYRRIERRMAVHKIQTLEEYVKYLQQTIAEAEALFLDLLIRVTSFFRDSEAFQALEQQVVPQLLAQKPEQESVRIWVPGCSTGEEAYSLAILLAEHQQRLGQARNVLVFATEYRWPSYSYGQSRQVSGQHRKPRQGALRKSRCVN